MGIPVVHICAVTDIAALVGSSRILKGFAITCPVGNPTAADEQAVVRRYLEKALEMLGQPGEKNRVEALN